MGNIREDDGFREIQLSGKQLVFLFMAATVVSVVIFLCGVLVGRGVKAERAATLQAEALSASPMPDQPPAPPAMPGGSDPRDAMPPAAVVGEIDGANGAGDAPPAELEEAPVAVERSSRLDRVEARKSQPTPPAAAKSAAPSKSSAASPPVAASAAKTPAAPAPPAPVAATTPATEAAPPRSGYAVQVAAVDGRTEADKMVKRLVDKGYAAYFEQPKGTRLYRVRVGTFQTRREAQAVATKLQKEEKFKPWVTR
ncbi:MAG: SPOR domain-containing protein [Vicinamibacterales bacterium]